MYTNIAQSLIAAGANVDIQTAADTVQDLIVAEKKLLEAARSGDTAKVKRLIDADVDVNVQNKVEDTALEYAVQNKMPHTAQLLVDAGAEENIIDDVAAEVR